MKHISKSLADTRAVAEAVLGRIRMGSTATVLALQGDLGAGKTAFAQEVGKLLGVEEPIQSPTFVIEKVYKINWDGFEYLIHIDAYRLETNSELLHLGWDEITSEPKNLILIEWPERVAELIPEEATRIQFKFIDEETREISYDEER